MELKTYKNYKEICEVMGWKVSAGKSKQLQIKDLERFCNYEKQGNKFVVNEIFDEPKPKEENKGGNTGKFKDIPQFNLCLDEYFNIGVYAIIKDNDIYIGSTRRSFRDRFLEHYRNTNGNHVKTYEMIRCNGEFIVLECMNGEDEISIRKKEQEYIRKYLNTGINVINGLKEVVWKGKGKSNPKPKSKFIKVNPDKYQEALSLLYANGIIDVV